MEAFDRFFAEQIDIARTADAPDDDAFENTATGVVREDAIADLAEDATFGTIRKGEPKFKNQTVTVTGVTALVVTCVNTDSWIFILDGGRESATDEGWRQFGREMTKIDGSWLVSAYSNESTADECP